MTIEYKLNAPIWRKKVQRNKQKIIVNCGDFMSYNKFQSMGGIPKKGRFIQNSLKNEFQEHYMRALEEQVKDTIDIPVTVHFHFKLTKLGTRDLDNIGYMASKNILDCMVKCDVLVDDKLKYVKGLSYTYELDESLDRECVVITLNLAV